MAAVEHSRALEGGGGGGELSQFLSEPEAAEEDREKMQAQSSETKRESMYRKLQVYRLCNPLPAASGILMTEQKTRQAFTNYHEGREY